MKFLTVDTETTGLVPYKNKVLTVGLLLADITKDHVKLLDESHIFVRHNSYNANPQALAVNKINLVEHHKVAINPSIACTKINQFIVKHELYKTPLLGHNIGFDKSFLSALFSQSEVASLLASHSVDTMHVWRGLKKREVVPSALRSNLQTVAEFFDLDYSNAHDALGDCRITASAYHKMLGLV